MFDFSLGELAVVALVAVLFIKPDDLPVIIRALAKWFGEAKRIAQELRAALADLAESSGLEDARRDIERHTRHIVDDNGDIQPVYDISDLMREDDKKPPHAE